MGFRSLLPCAALCVALFVTRDAHAGNTGLNATLWVEGAGMYMPNAGADAPSGQVGGVSNSIRTINGTTAPFGFAQGFFGVRSGIDFINNDRWIIPGIDIGFYGIMGSYTDQIVSADGSIFRIHPAGTYMFDGELFGFGVRFKKRRWMFEATLKPGFAMMGVPAAVADGKSFTDVDQLITATFTLRASLSACRRIDPSERVCLSVTPNIYQWGWGNGGSLSLRWEIGS